MNSFCLKGKFRVQQDFLGKNTDLSDLKDYRTRRTIQYIDENTHAHTHETEYAKRKQKIKFVVEIMNWLKKSQIHSKKGKA